jgi:integrase
VPGRTVAHLSPLPEEVQAGYRAQDAAVFVVAAYAGRRLGELRALRWRDVDFAKRLIHYDAHTRCATRTSRSQARSVPCR